MSLRALLITTLLLLALGCGQKGPLYIPDEEAAEAGTETE